MASHHRRHGFIPTPDATSCHFHCCCCCCTTTLPQHPMTTEPRLHQTHTHPHPHPHHHIFHSLHPQTHLYSSSGCFTPSYDLQFQAHHYQSSPNSFRNPLLKPPTSDPIVSSLIRRISALESAFLNLSPVSNSLLDVAARTIQTHFRAFLVRRSRTLRHLKDLASIKSALSTLRSSLSDKAHFDPPSLLREAMDLLLKLESIEGGDSMIRDGKRSIRVELDRFIEFIDGEKQLLLSQIAKRVNLDRFANKSRVFHSGREIDAANCSVLETDERELPEIMRGRFGTSDGISKPPEGVDEENVGLEAPGLSSLHELHQYRKHNNAKKSVRFAETSNVYRVFRPCHVPDGSNTFDGDVSVDGDGVILDNICEQVGSSFKKNEDGNECHLFSLPPPFKMESRADLMNKTNDHASRRIK